MALVVEDGTGLPTAESYVSVAVADAYHSAFGNAGWAGTVAEKEVALRRATQYIDSRYGFRGERASADQRLEWPRDWWPRDVFEWPLKELADATCELALRALAAPLAVDQDDRPVTQETVGPVSVSYGNSRFGGQVRYDVADRLLSTLTGGGGRLSRRLEVA